MLSWEEGLRERGSRLLGYRAEDRLQCTVALATIARMFFSFLAVLFSSPIESVRLPDDAISTIAPRGARCFG
jgi:hypothetical protein